MPRSRSAHVTCWMHTPYRKKNATLVYRFRYRLPQPGSERRLVQENVPQEVAWNARHKTRALEFMLRRQAELNTSLSNPAGAVSVRKAAGKYFDHMESRWRRGTARTNNSIINQFVQHVGPETQLASINGQVVIGYLDGRLHGRVLPEQPFRAATYNKHLRCLRAWFGRLVRTFDLIPRNPCAGVEQIDADPLPKNTLTDNQCAQLVAECMRRNRVDGLAVWMLAETGARIGSILSREWTDIKRVEDSADEGELLRAYIVLPKAATKGKRARIPPLLSPERTAQIEQYQMELRLCGRATGYAFRPWIEAGPNQWKQYEDDWSGKRLVRLVRSVCRDLGLPEVTPHRLRGTVATSAEELDVPSESVREAVGWSSQAVVDAHYLTDRALKNRALKHARKVADARQFGARVVEATS